MPFLRFISFSLLCSIIAAIVAFVLALIADNIYNYYGGRILYGYPWRDVVFVALVVWAVSAFWVGYALGALTIDSNTFPLCRVVLFIGSALVWLGAFLFMANWESMPLLALGLYSLAYGVFGALLGAKSYD